MADSIFIIMNSVSQKSPNAKNDFVNNRAVPSRWISDQRRITNQLEAYAFLCQKITEAKIQFGADILRQDRFDRAKKLDELSRIIIFSCGPTSLREKNYHSGYFVAAGKVNKKAESITDFDIKQLPELYQLARFCYGYDLVGIVYYHFRKGLGEDKNLLDKATPQLNFDPRKHQGIHFIEIQSNQPEYKILDAWWEQNY